MSNFDQFLSMLNGESGPGFAKLSDRETLKYTLHSFLDVQPKEVLSPEDGLKVIVKLVDLYPDVLMLHDRSGNLPIHYLCDSYKDKRAIECFSLVRPACLSKSNHQGQLPIHRICSSGLKSDPEREGAQLILDLYHQGAKTTDACGNLPVHLVACTTGNEQLLTKLHALYPEGFLQKNKQGKIPLSLCCGSDEMFCRMVELCPASLLGPCDQSSAPFGPFLDSVMGRMKVPRPQTYFLRNVFCHAIQPFVSCKIAFQEHKALLDQLKKAQTKDKAQAKTLRAENKKLKSELEVCQKEIKELKDQQDQRARALENKEKEVQQALDQTKQLRKMLEVQKAALVNKEKQAQQTLGQNMQLKKSLEVLQEQNLKLDERAKSCERDVKEKEAQLKQISHKNASEVDVLRKKNKELENVIEASQQEDQKTLQSVRNENKRIRDEYEVYRQKSRDDFANIKAKFEAQVKQITGNTKVLESELDVLRKKNKELEEGKENELIRRENEKRTLQSARDENKRVQDEYEAYRKKSRDEFANMKTKFEAQIKQIMGKTKVLESELDAMLKKNKVLEEMERENELRRENEKRTLQSARDENKRVRDEYEAYRKKTREEFARRFQDHQHAQRQVIEEGRKLDGVLIGMLDHSSNEKTPLLPMKAMKAFAESLHKRTDLLEAQRGSHNGKARCKVAIMFDTFMASPNLSRSSLTEFIHCSHQELEETLENYMQLSARTPQPCEVSDDTTETRPAKRHRISLETSDS